MPEIKIAVINESSEVSDAQVAAVTAALQVQVNRDFAPIWGVNADLRQVANRAAAAAGEWWLVILDDADQAGALGYHDLTGEGLPLGKVFARTTRLEGGNWTVTTSHELLEMLGDPDIDLTVLVQQPDHGGGQQGSRLYAYEVCDACEDDAYAYPVNGIDLSDFVFPSWFETFRSAGTQFDFQKQINKPLELLKGGYIGYYDLTGGSGWQQLTAANAFDYRARPRVGSRRERRRTPRTEWLRSEVRSTGSAATVAKAVGGGRPVGVPPATAPVPPPPVPRPVTAPVFGAAAPPAPGVALHAAAVLVPGAGPAAAPAAAPAPLTIDVAFEINTIWPAANAAYSIMSDPNPVLPAGFSLVGPIVAQTQNAAPAMAAASDPSQLRMAQQMMADSNIFGLVAWNAAESTAIVSIRGTQTVLEWIEDVDAVPVPFIAVPGAGLVHMGFQIVYEHIRLAIDALLAKVPAARRILVTGHSLGAAVAVMAAVDIAKNVPLHIVPELHTLAGPRTGAPDFATFVDNLIPVCHRIVNFMDVVPQVPTPPVYEHVGDETVVHGGFRVLDITFAHHLTTYLAGLQQLAQG